MPIRILIADDHGLIRAGLRALLEDVHNLHIVGEAADGLAVLRLCSELHPDVVLMDISMSGLNGIETTRQEMQLPHRIRRDYTAHSRRPNRRCGRH